MRKTDISQYGKKSSSKSNIAPNKRKKNSSSRLRHVLFVICGRAFLSLFIIMIFTGIMLLFSLNTYRKTLLENDIALNITSSKVPLTSFIYSYDKDNNIQEYQKIYSHENRVWVDFSEIPKHMKDAIISIEDKRFYDHGGIDLKRTIGAVLNFTKGSKTYGGSTLTQQLIKNITEDNEVSLTRKLREIFRAIELEKRFSKDEILECYLNIVNFGGGSRGVETAANLYFNKSIRDCSIAECAAIAGITQNPAAYNPLYHPDNNKNRREIVMREMYEQDRITKQEYEQALRESSVMKFEDYSKKTAEELSNSHINNWYVETLLRDITNDLCEKYNIGKAAAENMIYSQGLKIYSCVDTEAQNITERIIKDPKIMPSDKNLEVGYTMMDLNGRILATIGSRKEKTGNLLYDRANVARRQPGSTIKPISAYTPIIDQNIYNYSSLIPDQPVKVLNSKGEYIDWPNNWYKSYKGHVTLQWAIEKSANAPVAQLINLLTPAKSYEFLTKKLGFTSLDSSDSVSLSALATGGTHYGVTPREMTGAFQIFGNGGKYYKPYTYYYVTDRNDKILLDNRNNIPIKSVSSKTATIMNRLLRNVVIGSEGTGRSANIPDWNVIGKTGTTNDDYDSWFIGLTPHAVAGIWTGYDNPKRIHETGAAIRIWKNIMTEYLKNKPKIDFNYDPDVISATYCKHSGKLATINCSNVSTGYYAPENIPETCNVCSSIIAEPDYENISEEENNQDTATNSEEQENNNSFLGSLFDNFF
ncbi:MAG: transglycosylase domain-containing protein [Clostridia bacterium]|nr:transglycosylase domain-containing protein [Clostridia bacterium]